MISNKRLTLFYHHKSKLGQKIKLDTVWCRGISKCLKIFTNLKKKYYSLILSDQFSCFKHNDSVTEYDTSWRSEMSECHIQQLCWNVKINLLFTSLGYIVHLPIPFENKRKSSKLSKHSPMDVTFLLIQILIWLVKVPFF